VNTLTVAQEFVLYELRDIDQECDVFHLWSALAKRHGEARFSRRSVHQHLDALEKKGVVVSLTTRRGRRVRLTGKAPR